MPNDLKVATRPDFGGSLPEWVRTRGGASFDPRANIWAYRDGMRLMSLNFNRLAGLSETLLTSLKSALVWYAENRSADHLANLFVRMEHLQRFLQATSTTTTTSISSIDLINYRHSLKEAQQPYMANLAGLLKKWHALGLLGVTEDAVRFLEQVRLKGTKSGAAVLTMDPWNGPFTDIELGGIQAALKEAYADRRLDQGAYLLAWLFMLLGQRSVQYAALKVCDASVGRSEDGAAVYILQVPRAKQRDAKLRTQFKERLIIPEVGELLINHAARVKRQFARQLPDPSQAPLFPTPGKGKIAPGFEFHRTSDSLSEWLKGALGHLNVRSERTGEPLHITPVRFRRTVATRAATEGYGELIIAELLDHSDILNVGIYVQATPAIVERIDRAIALSMAPLAQAFAGVLIKDDSEATRREDPASRIVDPRIDASLKPMGSCGQYDFCALAAPIACYTCRNFQPWLDGPHEAMLAYLLAKREQFLASTDARIASVNDRTILAVAEVIRRCEEARLRPCGQSGEANSHD